MQAILILSPEIKERLRHAETAENPVKHLFTLEKAGDHYTCCLESMERLKDKEYKLLNGELYIPADIIGLMD